MTLGQPQGRVFYTFGLPGQLAIPGRKLIMQFPFVMFFVCISIQASYFPVCFDSVGEYNISRHYYYLRLDCFEEDSAESSCYLKSGGQLA